MSSNSFRVRKSLVIMPESSPTLSDQGELAYDSATDKLRIRSAASTGDIVEEAKTQTLTNKTLTSPTISGPAVSGTVSATGIINILNSTLTGTTAASNVLASVSSTVSGRDATLRFGDNVNASAHISYLSGALSLRTNGTTVLTANVGGTGVNVTGTFTVSNSIQSGDSTNAGLAKFKGYNNGGSGDFFAITTGATVTKTIGVNTGWGYFLIQDQTGGDWARVVYANGNNLLTITNEAGTTFVTGAPGALESQLTYVNTTGELSIKNGYPTTRQYQIIVLGY